MGRIGEETPNPVNDDRPARHSLVVAAVHQSPADEVDLEWITYVRVIVEMLLEIDEAKAAVPGRQCPDRVIVKRRGLREHACVTRPTPTGVHGLHRTVPPHLDD
jgi:hypothetical protein